MKCKLLIIPILIFSIALVLPKNTHAQYIQTVAGIGSSSFSGDGSSALLAELAQPVSVAVDASGNVYISDQGNHRIRKITKSTGVISTVAGSSSSGYSGDGSAATSAKLYYPEGIAVDASGNIYIADKGNNRVRKVSASTGIITTIAGTGTAGFSGDGSAATSAKLNNPAGVAIDDSGNVYIADQYNQRIRKIDASTGNISTIAGTGTYGYSGDGSAATSATFQNPSNVEIDDSGNVFIADLFNHVIRKITKSTGVISTIAGTGSAGFSGDGAAATSAKLNYPIDMSIDDTGNIFIATQYSHRIRKITASTGYISTVVGTGTAGYSGDGGLASAAQINYPSGLIADGGGNLYIADRENHRIRYYCNYALKPTVTSPVNYCVGDIASALSATGSSLKWYTSLTATTGSSSAPTPSTLSAGTTKYYVASVSPYGCEGPRDSITVNVHALPAAPTVSSPVNYCVGATATALTSSGFGLSWYTSATGGTASRTAPTPSTASVGTTTYYVSQKNSDSCEGPRAAIAVIVSDVPSAPIATSTISYCQGASATALSAIGTSLKWYTVASGGTGSSVAPTPSTSTAGTTTYYVSQSNSCGESPRTAISVTVHATPSSPSVTSPINYCQYQTASTLSASGTLLKWYTTATGGTGSSTAPTPSTSTAGTFYFYVSQSDTSSFCESARATITVNINAAPSAPTVSSPINYCVGDAATALTASGTGLLWYSSASGGTGSSTAPTPSTLSAGTSTYYVSQTSATTSCESIRSAIVVNVYAFPSKPIVSSPIKYCKGASASALTASGTSLKWYTTATGGTGSSTAPIPSTASVDTLVYYVSQTSSGICESPRDSIVVYILDLPTAPSVVSPINYCQNETASPLSATGTGLKWYTSATGGIGTGTAPTPSTSTVGLSTYYVSQINSDSCEGPRAAIVVNIKALAAAPTVSSPVTLCKGSSASALSASGTALVWYTTATGGTGSRTAPTPSTSSIGTTTYYVSQKNGDSCEGPRATIVVNVIDTPSAPTVTSPINYCKGETASALTASGDSLTWYSSGSSVGSSTAPTPSTASVGVDTFYVSQKNSCGESAKATIIVNVNPVPDTPLVTSPITYCQGDTAVAPLSATGTNLKWYTSPTGGTGSTTAIRPSTTDTGTFTYYVSQTNAYGCESQRSRIIVKIIAAPPPPIVVSPIHYCKGETAVALTATGTGLLWYTSMYGGVGSSTAPVPSTSTVGSTTYYVSQSGSGSCPSLRASITVIVHDTPSAPIVVSPILYCQYEIASALTASTTAGDTLKWYSSPTGGSPSLSAPSISTTTADTLEYYVSSTSQYGCGEGPRSLIQVIIKAKPTPPTLSSPIHYCKGAIASALSATGVNLKWYSSLTGLSYTTTAPTPSTATVGITKYYVSQTINSCESDRDSISVQINDTPASPTFTSPITYCVGATTTAVSATAPSGSSLLWYSSAIGGTGSTTAPTPSSASAHSDTFYVSSINSSNCESARKAIIVNIINGPGAPVVVTPVNYCKDETTTALSATGTALKWYDTAVGGVALSSAPTPSSSTVHADTFYVSQSTSCGESARARIIVNINPNPSAPSVISPLRFCKDDTATALTATGSSLKWYSNPTGGIGSSSTPSISTNTVGVYKFYVSQTNTYSCESKRDSIIVTIDSLPNKPSVIDSVHYCKDAIADTLTASGINLKWYSTLSSTTALSFAPLPSTSIVGVNSFYVSQTNALGCESERAVINVKTHAIPSAPSVTSPVEFCEKSIASALTASGTSLRWYKSLVGDTGTLSAPIPNTSLVDTFTYYVSQSSSIGCESPKDSIIVIIKERPSIPIVTDSIVSYCQYETATSLSASGTSLKWYTVATGGSGSSTAPTPSTSSSGTFYYYVSQTNTLNCESERKRITVNVHPKPSKPTVSSPINYCSGDSAIALTATGTDLKWYSSASGGTGSSTAPIPSTLSTGTFPYYVSQSSSYGCESDRELIDVVVYATPAAPTVGFVVTLCLGVPASPLTAIGSGLKWYTTATGGVGSSTAPTPSTATTGSVYYYVSQTSSGGCESPRAAILVNIDTLLDPPTVTSPISYCVGDSALPLTASGSHLRWYIDTSTSYTSTAPTPNTSVADTLKYYVAQESTAGCEGHKDSIIVYVNPLPAAPSVTSPINYCVGETAAALTASGTSLLWYTSATGGTGSSTAPTPSTASTGTTTYYVSQKNGDSCEGPRAAIVVNVNPLPSAPSVTSPITYCVSDTATALTASGTSLLWYTSAIGGTGSSTAPTPSTASSGTTTYYVSQQNAYGCEGPRAAIVVNVNPLPAAPSVTSPVNYCVGDTAAALTASGTSLLWYTTATGGTGSSTAPTPSTTSSGTTTYYVSQQNTYGCEGPRAAIVVNVNPLPTAPSVTSPINYCVGDTASALTASGTSLLWYTAATGGTGSSTAPTPSTASSGTTTYYVSQQNTYGCEGPRAAIVVNVNPLPTAPSVTSPINYCVGDTASALTASGTSLLWYTSATGGTGSSTAPTPSTASSGTTTYYVSQSYSTSCEGPRAAIVVNVNPLPAAPSVTSPISYCVGDTASALTASGTSLLWYTSATGGTGSSTAPTPSTATSGTSTYYVSQQNTYGCEGPRAAIEVKVNPLPSAPSVTSPVNYCVGDTAAALTASGTSLLWYTSATGGTGSSTAPTPNTATSGTTTYYVSQQNTYSCEGPRAAIVVNVNPLPAAPSVTSPVNYCVGDTASALTASGTSLLWYTSATGGTGSSTAPTPSTASSGTTTYYVSQRYSTSCEGPRAAIVVNVNPLPAAPSVTSPISYCVGDTASALTASGTSLLWYTSATGGTGSSTAPTPSTASSGTTTYYVSQQNTYGCEGPRAAIEVKVNPLPSAPSVTSPVNYCVGDTAAALTASGTSLLWYTSATGGTGSSTAPTPSTASIGTTSYYVSQQNTYGCEGPRAAIVVNVNPLPAAPSVTSPINYCVGDTASALTASGTSLLWYTAATGGTGSSTAPTPSTASSGTTTYYVSQRYSTSCEGPRAAIVVNVNPLPAAPSVTSPISYCVGDTASALTASGTSLLWYTSATGGTGSSTAPTPSTASSGTTTYYVSQQNTYGCEGPRAAIEVKVNPLPSAPSVTSPVNYCVGDTAAALTASGTSLLWYTSATGGTGSSTAPTPNTATSGTTTYYVSQQNTYSCEGPRAAIVVNVNPLPAAPSVTSPVNYCVGDTASALTASGTSLLWYTSATGGTGSSTAPTPSTASSGTTTYYVSQSYSTSCEGPRAAIVVNVNPLPAAPSVTSPINYCVGDSATALTASGTSLLWYTAATGGSGSSTAPTPSTASSGTTTYYVSQQNAYGCEGPRAAIVVNVNPLPAAPSVTSPVNYCMGDTAAALTASGSSLLWYTSATGGTGSSTAPTPSTASSGTTTYYVSQQNAYGCEGPRAAIVVNVNPLPAAPSVTSPVNYCVGDTASALTASGTSLLWYTSATGGIGSSTAPTPSTVSSGTTTYYVSQQNTYGCEGPRAAIVVNVNPLPAAPSVTSPITYCVGDSATALTASGTSLLWYTSATGGIGSSTAPTPSTASSGTTTYYVSQQNTYGCEGPRAAIVVVINSKPTPPSVIDTVGYCKGALASALSASGSSLKWYSSLTGGVGSSTAPTPSTISLGIFKFYVSQTSTEGCESERALINVEVVDQPDIKLEAVGKIPFVFCKKDSVTIKAISSVKIYTYEWYRNSLSIAGASSDSLRIGVNGLYKVLVTGKYGCINEASQYVFEDTLPEPKLSPTDLLFCPNVNIVLFTTPSYPKYTYVWYKDGLIVPGASSDKLIISKAGDYHVLVTDSFGCTSETNHTLASTYPPVIKPKITRAGSLLSVAPIYKSYQWYRNYKVIPSATAPNYVMPAFGGIFYCIVTDVNDCSEVSDTLDTDNTTSIASSQIQQKVIKIYPNPTSDVVFIDADMIINIKLYDAIGRSILEQKNAKAVHLEPYADGVYFISLFDEKGIFLGKEKILKQSN